MNHINWNAVVVFTCYLIWVVAMIVEHRRSVTEKRTRRNSPHAWIRAFTRRLVNRRRHIASGRRGHERDPKGLDPHAPGAKLDADKVRPSLVVHGFPRALLAIAQIATYGAAKYTDGGWQEVENGQVRYTDAMYRHLLDEAIGQQVDPDSGLLHAAHSAWNALARLELMLRHKEKLDAKDAPP